MLTKPNAVRLVQTGGQVSSEFGSLAVLATVCSYLRLGESSAPAIQGDSEATWVFFKSERIVTVWIAVRLGKPAAATEYAEWFVCMNSLSPLGLETLSELFRLKTLRGRSLREVLQVF